MTDRAIPPRRLLWIVPERQGGIASYGRIVWPAVATACHEAGDFEPLDLLDGDDAEIVARIEAGRDPAPDLVHVQHEYGLFGGRNPCFDRFPRWLRRLRRRLPATSRIVATAHTVVPADHRFETRGQGWRNPFHAVANATALPWLHRRWSTGTWGMCDGVAVHSRLQLPDLRADAGTATTTIPHVVPIGPPAADTACRGGAVPRITVFGYFCPEKGQDLAIEAVSHCRQPLLLRLAGGPRLPRDDGYVASCLRRIDRLGLSDRVEVTGFVPPCDMAWVFRESDLVLAPFRWTSGSGSLAHAFAHGASVLASDLPLNREINERVPGTLAFFRTADPVDCGRQIERLLAEPDTLRLQAIRARQYAETFSPAAIASRHLDFYRRVLDSRTTP